MPLRPITLVFGPNSGGKSSILHSLLWMKDVVGGKGLDIYHPSSSGTSVDLGGFKQTRHGNDPETALSVKLRLNLKDGRGHDHSLQSISMFAASAAPADYARRLKALVAERFAGILARNSLEKLAIVFWFLDKFVIKRALTRLLTVDHGEFTVERLLDDYEEGRDDSVTSWEKLREDNCPGLQVLHESDVGGAPVIVDGLGNVVVTKETSQRFTADELVAELQTLALAVLKTLKLQPPPGVAEMKPSLIRFELSEQGVTVFCAARDHENSLTVQHVDAPWLTEFSQVKGAGSSLLVSEEDFAVTAKGIVFNDRNSWLPQEPLFVPQPAGLESPATQERVLDHLIGSPEIPGLLLKCQAAAERQCAALSYLGPLRAYPARTMTVAELPQTPDPEGLFA